MPEEDFEALITQALTDRGGPPEIAPQLLAIAQQQEISPYALKSWITYHIAEEWSAAQFATWCEKYKTTMDHLKVGENPLENR